jgi:hypothetical protein
MTQCSSPYFEINPNKQSCLFGISYVPDESKLHPYYHRKQYRLGSRLLSGL